MKKLFALFVAFCVLTMPVGAPQHARAATDVATHSTLTTSLASYWEMNETSTGVGAVTRVDAHSANTNDLTDNNTTESINNTLNSTNAANFKRANSEYLSITDANQTGLDITGDMSVSAWVNPQSFTSGEQYRVICKDDGQPQRSYCVGLENSAGTPKAQMYNSSDGTNANTTSLVSVNVGTVTAGTWYHFIWIYTASAGKIEVYKDGQGMGTTTGLKTSTYNSSAVFKVGGAAGAYLNAYMDNLGVWSKTLSATEIKDLYNGGVPLPYSAGGGGSVEENRNSYYFFQ
jgi:hypothetical protein